MIKILGVIFSTLFCSAIIASAKAIVDVRELKTENKNTEKTLNNMRNDIKDIRNYLLDGRIIRKK